MGGTCFPLWNTLSCRLESSSKVTEKVAEGATSRAASVQRVSVLGLQKNCSQPTSLTGRGTGTTALGTPLCLYLV